MVLLIWDRGIKNWILSNIFERLKNLKKMIFSFLLTSLLPSENFFESFFLTTTYKILSVGLIPFRNVLIWLNFHIHILFIGSSFQTFPPHITSSVQISEYIPPGLLFFFFLNSPVVLLLFLTLNYEFLLFCCNLVLLLLFLLHSLSYKVTLTVFKTQISKKTSFYCYSLKSAHLFTNQWKIWSKGKKKMCCRMSLIIPIRAAINNKNPSVS